MRNKEIDKYFDLLCNNDYPTFLNKYLEVKELVRLKQIGQFCGCDYTKIFNIKYWYSRFDHSVATALMTWNFTKSKAQTLAALFHDLGTPAFSHSIDFMLGDSVNQESSEISVKDIINNSVEIKKLLIIDNIDINLIYDLSMYTIIENKKPKLCVDRLDGILHTVLIWLNTWSLEEVSKLYKKIAVLTNEYNELELGFNKEKDGEKFFNAVYEYSIVLQQNEDKFILQYIGDAVKYLIDKKIIEYKDLYILSEKQIIKLFEKHIKSWKSFAKAKNIVRTEDKPILNYFVSVDSKKRNVIPLCKINDKIIRLDKISNKVDKKIKYYNEYFDSKYSYIDKIKEFN